MARALPFGLRTTRRKVEELSDMDFSRVPSLLQATFGQDPQHLKAAEAELDTLSEVSGFPSCLFQIASSDTDLALRQSAAVLLKNLVERHYKIRQKRAGEVQPFELHEQDKAVLRQNIVESVIVAPSQIRKMLEACVGKMVEYDYPAIWTDLVQKIVGFLSSDQEGTWLGACLCALQVAKRFRWKQGNDRQPMLSAMQLVLPLLRQHMLRLVPNQSELSATIQKTIVKVFHHVIEMSLPMALLPEEEFSSWIEIFRSILVLDVPAETLEEEEDLRSSLVWWKLRRWVSDTLEILFDRYGCPLQVSKKYKQFAHQYCSKYNVDVLGALLNVLDKYRRGVYVAPIVLFHCLGYLKLAVRHSSSWKRVLCQHAAVLVQQVVFPLLCYTDADDELWKDDPYEYIRLHYDAFEDYTNPVTEAQGLVHTMCSKRQGMLQQVLEFCSQILAKSDNPRHKDGALHLIGICHDSLVKKKELRQIVERQLFAAHIIPSFTAPEGFRRARACWILRQFSSLKLKSETLSTCVTFVLQSLTTEKELPVKIEAALALQEYLVGAKQTEEIQALLRDQIVVIVQGLLATLQESRNEELTSVIETVINVFEEIKGVAVELTHHLVASFMLIVRPDEDDPSEVDLDSDGGYKALTAMGVLDCIKQIAANYEDEKEILSGMENECLPLMMQVLEVSISDFYEEVFDLAEGFLMTTISPQMWSLFEMLCRCIVRDAMDYFPDMCSCFHLFVTTDKEAFIAVPGRLKLLVQILQKVMDESEDEVSPCTACRLLEVVIVQHPDAFDIHAIKLLVETALKRLQETEDVKSASLRTSTQQVILALLYCQTEALLQVLEQQGITQHFLAQWLQDISIYEGIHGHKLSVMAACRLLSLPAPSRPVTLQTVAPHLLPKMIEVFGRLTKLYEEQRRLENEGDDEMEEEDDGDETEEEGEELDDDADDIDPEEGEELEPDCITQTHGIAAADDGADDDDDDDDPDDAFSWMETGIDAEDEDATDCYFVFVETMKLIEGADAAWYAHVVAELTPEHQRHLQDIMQLATHRKAERESHRIEAQGGYQFNVQNVPASFNFG